MLNVLEDLIPAAYRKYVVYILIPLFVLIYGVYQSVQGDWTAFWPALVPAIIGWLVAAPNTHPSLDVSETPTFEATDDTGASDTSMADQPDPRSPAIIPSEEASAAAAANAEPVPAPPLSVPMEELQAAPVQPVQPEAVPEAAPLPPAAPDATTGA